jgi:hypothetical protein
MKINIKYHDIVNYVLGFCSYHPLELIIDPLRYKIGDDYISDSKTGYLFYQNDDYSKFMQKISTLKMAVKNFDTLQVQGFCREIEQFAPLEVRLS